MRALVLSIILLFVSPAIGQQPKAITNSIGMKLVLILPGSFTMGSPIEEVGRQDETQHLVTISNWYYLGVYEVTQGEYEKITGESPSGFKGAKKPVEKVNWDNAVSFCKKLSEIPEEKEAGRTYRLPTEAEWEYACRAGSKTAYSFGDSDKLLEECALFGEGREGPEAVGQRKPNRWGLYDMHGNVWEWCQDWFISYPSNDAADPKGPWVGELRVSRGGSWKSDAASCRSAARRSYNPRFSFLNGGFRVAMSLPAKQPEAVSSK